MASPTPRLLIADDDETNRGFLTKFLTRAGFSVTTAGSGEEAITAAETGSFDLMLLDVEMPGWVLRHQTRGPGERNAALQRAGDE